MNLSSLIADLTKKHRAEVDHATKQKEMSDRLEALKKPPEVIFNELLYDRSNLLKLSDDLWPCLRDNNDFGKTIESKIKTDPDFVEIKKWHQTEMAAIKAEKEE
jgi:hypothetical protein